MSDLTDKEKEEKYLKGYNDGHVISRYENNLFRELSDIKAEGPYFDGLRRGKTVSMSHDFKENFMPDWLKGDYFQENKEDLTKDKNKDKGIDPDI